MILTNLVSIRNKTIRFKPSHRFKRWLGGFLLIIGWLGCAWAVNAHQQKEAYITLFSNPNTKMFEITHRFLIHDAQHIISEVLKNSDQYEEATPDLISNPATQSAFADYVERKFMLADQSKSPIKIESIGYELEGKYFWVYQETVIPSADKFFIKHQAFQEVWPDQTNHINLEVNGKVSSLRLTKTESRKWNMLELAK